MKTNKKKIIVLVSMILLLVSTGVLNYYINAKAKNTDEKNINVNTPSVTLTFFESNRQVRAEGRQEELSILNELIEQATSTEVVTDAQAQKLAIAKAIETEHQLETLIKAKGFDDVLVEISSKLVNVIVKKEGVTVEDAAKILEVILSQTDYSAKDVRVVPYV
ncbi:MAG: SpoIIIAH-like family protein [Christensenellaceae bacterium]|jgi:stage III sporulation protein AH|nr:SpoIIIAH-like family protein [Christensenellaceae bacterium]